MTSVTPKDQAALLNRVGRLLSLGEVIADLSLKTNATPFARAKATDRSEPDVLRKRIDTLTKELQQQIPSDKYMEPLRQVFASSDKSPPLDHIQVLALVAFASVAATCSRESIDTIALKASAVFSENRIEGVLHARQVIAEQLLSGALILHGEGISVCGYLRHWIAGMNEYAAFGLTQREIESFGNSLGVKELPDPTRKTIRKYIEAVPLLTPQEMFDEIGRHGFIGQEAARRAISLAAHRHILRLRRVHIEGLNPDHLPLKENCLIMGPTGSGKSFLIKTLFNNILKLPTALIDASTITEVGYVGEDAHIVLTKLYHAAERNLEWAQCGISCIDEFDKIAATGRNTAVFGGAGSRNDVSRGGVQRSLLKLLEEDSAVDIPADNGASINRSRRLTFQTANVLFLACGAFSGIESILQQNERIGFSANGMHSPQAKEANSVAALSQYGLFAELLGRFGPIVTFPPLSTDDLMVILERNTISRYGHELELSGIDLCVEQEAKQLIVTEAMDRGLGARGIASGMVEALSGAAFEAYSAGGNVTGVRVYAESGAIRWDVKRKRPRKAKRQKLIQGEA